MNRHMLGLGLAVMVAASLATPVVAAPSRSPRTGQLDLVREVRHELVMLPYYTIFDNLGYQVENGTVILSGQVRRPTLKTDAGNVVRRIPGVTKVVNNIEVLPLSPMDDRIRLAEFRTIYSFPTLNRYALAPVPSIHIIVRNGHVTLAGVVDNQTDKNVASLEANSVRGVFSVTNDLKVVK
ncbi:MAG: BON domain-containing protein [Bryobacteraceae bacterium]